MIPLFHFLFSIFQKIGKCIINPDYVTYSLSTRMVMAKNISHDLNKQSDFLHILFADLPKNEESLP